MSPLAWGGHAWSSWSWDHTGKLIWKYPSVDARCLECSWEEKGIQGPCPPMRLTQGPGEWWGRLAQGSCCLCVHHPAQCSVSGRMLETAKTSWTWQLNYPNAQRRNEVELGWICQALALASDKCQCFRCRFGWHFTPNTHGWTQSPGQDWTGEDATEVTLFTWLRVDHFLLGMFL